MDNFGPNEAMIGDAGVLAGVIEPAGLTTELWLVRVELTGRGRGVRLWPTGACALRLNANRPGSRPWKSTSRWR